MSLIILCNYSTHNISTFSSTHNFSAHQNKFFNHFFLYTSHSIQNCCSMVHIPNLLRHFIYRVNLHQTRNTNLDTINISETILITKLHVHGERCGSTRFSVEECVDDCVEKGCGCGLITLNSYVHAYKN